MFHHSVAALLIATLGACAAAGCDQSASAAGAQPAPASSPSAQPASASVARLVFLDKEEACDCTQAKIDAGWAAIQAALGAGKPLAVERIHMDTQPDAAAPLLAKRKVFAVPALYALDQGGTVVELLQGDIEEAAVRKVLQ